MPTVQKPVPQILLSLLLCEGASVWDDAAHATVWQKVSVCELLRGPAQYVGHTIEVVGQTEGHWFESAPLRDRTCRGVGYIELEGEKSSGIDQLRRASAAADVAGTELPGVVAVLKGRFERGTGGSHRYVLMVEKVIAIGKTRVPSAVLPIPPRKSPRRTR
jgi:hypothetical protein